MLVKLSTTACGCIAVLAVAAFQECNSPVRVLSS